MLLLTRYTEQDVVIRLSDHVDPATPVGELISEPITVRVVEIPRNGRVRLGFSAGPEFKVVREEIVTDVELRHGL
jgi:hypothetical protein